MQTNEKIRYGGREMIKKMINGDKRSALGETSYLKRMRGRLFWQSFWYFLALILATAYVLQPAAEQLFFHLLLSYGTGAFAVGAVLLIAGEQVLRAAIAWNLVNGSIASWREKTMVETVLAGNSLESLAFFPARSLFGGWFWSVIAFSFINLFMESGQGAAMAGGSGSYWTGAAVGLLIMVYFAAHIIAFLAWLSIFLTMTSKSFLHYLFGWLAWGARLAVASIAIIAGVLLGIGAMVAVFGGPSGRVDASVPPHLHAIVGFADGNPGLMAMCVVVALVFIPFFHFTAIYSFVGKMLVQLRALESTIADKASVGD